MTLCMNLRPVFKQLNETIGVAYLASLQGLFTAYRMSVLWDRLSCGDT